MQFFVVLFTCGEAKNRGDTFKNIFTGPFVFCEIPVNALSRPCFFRFSFFLADLLVTALTQALISQHLLLIAIASQSFQPWLVGVIFLKQVGLGSLLFQDLK